ncbi:uncharacterized protein LOC117521950 isoform X2 [Thalassophryne amazonica]|uniref:uncharacterized protein LOC117521950 isoform X2 n=1 Tax=Thalassophryne amazonica TaxID=390379 RepID=UPI0014713075|nr:uncharacterized protein LOC117521950 isoform X2 [Thalassophryne amazonica]
MELLDVGSSENQEVPDFTNHDIQEPLNVGNMENQEVLDFTHHETQELVDVRKSESQEVLDFTHLDTQEPLDHNNQEMADLLSMDIPEANNQCILDSEMKASSSDSSGSSDICNSPPSTDLLGLDFSNTSIYTSSTTNTCPDDKTVIQDHSTFSTSHNPLEGDLCSVFGAGGYISCPDVADDLELLDNTRVNSRVEPEPPVRPVRPPRPSLRAKEKGQSQTQGIDLK